MLVTGATRGENSAGRLRPYELETTLCKIYHCRDVHARLPQSLLYVAKFSVRRLRGDGDVGDGGGHANSRLDLRLGKGAHGNSAGGTVERRRLHGARR